MVLNLDDLHQIRVGIHANGLHAGGLELRQIVVVELVAVAVTLRNIELCRRRAATFEPFFSVQG